MYVKIIIQTNITKRGERKEGRESNVLMSLEGSIGCVLHVTSQVVIVISARHQSIKGPAENWILSSHCRKTVSWCMSSLLQIFLIYLNFPKMLDPIFTRSYLCFQSGFYFLTLTDFFLTILVS